VLQHHPDGWKPPRSKLVHAEHRSPVLEDDILERVDSHTHSVTILLSLTFLTLHGVGLRFHQDQFLTHSQLPLEETRSIYHVALYFVVRRRGQYSATAKMSQLHQPLLAAAAAAAAVRQQRNRHLSQPVHQDGQHLHCPIEIAFYGLLILEIVLFFIT